MCDVTKFITLRWQHCVLKSLKLVVLSYLQEESQVYVFHLLVKVGFLPFYEHRLFELYLVFSSCRIQDLEAVQCSGCLARL